MAVSALTPQQFRTGFRLWHDRNGDKLQDEVQLATELSPVSDEEAPYITIETPADATQETRVFLLDEAALLDQQFELQDRLKDASPEQRRDEWKQWYEHNASWLEAHLEEAAGESFLASVTVSEGAPIESKAH